MSDAPTSSPDDQAPAPEVKPVPLPAAPRRKERAVIKVLLVVLAIEGVAYGRMMLTHLQMSREIQKAEQEHHIITRDRVNQIFGREPDDTHTVKAPVGEERYDVYHFWGLLQQRYLYVHYGVQGLKAEPEVLEVTTIIPDEVLASR
jgi:hypothetical protein